MLDRRLPWLLGPLCATVVACASAPAARPGRGSTCEVWKDGIFSPTVVTIEGKTAIGEGVFSPRKLAFMRTDGTIYTDGLLGENQVAAFVGERLVIDRLFGDVRSERIGGGKVELPGIFSPTVHHYGAACATWARRPRGVWPVPPRAGAAATAGGGVPAVEQLRVGIDVQAPVPAAEALAPAEPCAMARDRRGLRRLAGPEETGTKIGREIGTYGASAAMHVDK